MIKFEKTVKHAKILSPLKHFQEEIRTFEYRADPLTGRNTTVIKDMLTYVNKFLVSNPELLNPLIEETRASCPFCPENVKTRTPMFPPEFLKEGRIFVGEATVVPNLLGHAEQSVLAILSHKHYLKLDEFNPKRLVDGFKGGVEYLNRLNAVDKSAKYPEFIFNYLTPAGSSILHPHMQILVRDRPFYLINLMLEKSRAYFEKNGSNYWKDLMDKERGGERYLFSSEEVEWIVPFAPLRGLNEVQAIVKEKSNLRELNDKEWLGLAQGISKILKFYQSQNYSSFNIVLMSGPMDEHLDYFDVSLRMVSRPGITPYCFTEAWAAPYLLWDGEAVEVPERLAERIKEFIKKT